MRADAVSVAEAARLLGKDPSTVRRMIAAGAPTVRPGSAGRGRGARVVVADLIRWRRTGGAPAVLADEWLARLADELLAFHRERRHRLIRLSNAEAAALYHDLFAFIARRAGSSTVPESIALLAALARQP